MMNGFGDVAEIERLRADLAASAGVRVSYHHADLSRAAEVAALVAATEAEFGGVDIRVNNAGLQHVAPVEDFPPEKWDQLRAVILDASFHTTRAALPAFRSTVVGRPADQRR